MARLSNRDTVGLHALHLAQAARGKRNYRRGGDNRARWPYSARGTGREA